MRYNSIFTVTTPASDYSLVALDAVKDELSIADGTQDTRLARWVLEAGAALQGPAGINRVLRAETATESFRARSYHFDAPGEHFYPRNSLVLPETPGLRLRRYPIISVVSIVEDGITLDPAVDYEIDGEASLIYRLSGSSRVSWYGQSIVVTYTGGYADVADVPRDIQFAMFIMLRYRQSLLGRDPMLRQLNIPGVADKQWWMPAKGDTAALPPEVEELICGYRDVHV